MKRMRPKILVLDNIFFPMGRVAVCRMPVPYNYAKKLLNVRRNTLYSLEGLPLIIQFRKKQGNYKPQKI
jgi:hypothetical protein